MARLRTLYLTLCASLATPAALHACSCVETLTVDQALERAQMVFAGRVIRVRPPAPWTPDTIRIHEALFAIEHQWKGPPLDTITVIFVETGGSCDSRLETGRSYLIYAETAWDPKLPLYVHECQRTQHLSLAGVDLAALGPGRMGSYVSEATEGVAAERAERRLGLVVGSLLLGGFLGYVAGRRRAPAA